MSLLYTARVTICDAKCDAHSVVVSLCHTLYEWTSTQKNGSRWSTPTHNLNINLILRALFITESVPYSDE